MTIWFSISLLDKYQHSKNAHRELTRLESEIEKLGMNKRSMELELDSLKEKKRRINAEEIMAQAKKLNLESVQYDLQNSVSNQSMQVILKGDYFDMIGFIENCEKYEQIAIRRCRILKTRKNELLLHLEIEIERLD